MSHRSSPGKTLAEIVRLQKFLFRHLRPEWRLFLVTIALTAVFAGASAARGYLAKGVIEVFQMRGSEPRTAAAPSPAPAAAGTAIPAPASAAPAATPPTGQDAGEPARGGAAAPGAPRKGALARALGWIGDRIGLGARPDRLERAHIVGLWEKAKLYAALAGVIALVLGASGYLKEYYHEALVMRVVTSIRERVTEHVLGLSLRFFHRQRLGDLYSRLTNDVGQVNQALTFLFGDIVEDVLKIAAGVAMCLLASPLLSLTALVAGPAVILPIAKFGEKVRKRARTRQGSAADVTESMQQMLSGIRTVKAFGGEGHEIARFRDRNRSLIRTTLRVVRVKALSKGLLEAINNGIVPVILLGGIWLVREDLLGAPDLGWFIASLVLMYEPARRITKSFNNLQESLAGLDRLDELLREESEVTDAPDARPLADVRDHVALRAISFSYGHEPVLKDVTLEARAGEVVALVGPSGAGKSTLLDLIARFYDPDEGTVEIDGRDIRTVTRASLTSQLAIVTQDPFLFNDTILENLRYGRRDAPMADVEAACRAANIHELVASLPRGYETVVGERGATLSGGQRQRVTIARALLKDPRILLLDEATSALDSSSERAVQEALERLMRGRTTFVVAHRLSTVTNADRIVVLDEGRVVEVGSHEELVRSGGLYAKLHALQSGGDRARAAGNGAPEGDAIPGRGALEPATDRS